jgi:hypothetical protein
VGDKQERLDNGRITNWTFVQYLDGRCPLNMLDEHFLVPINARFARVMYICGTERGEGDARLLGREYRMPIVQSEG